MFLLALLLSNQADAAKLIATLARAQGISFTRLAAEAEVQKASLLRFCKMQEGGYLSKEATERVLSVLGWEKGGLTRQRVHFWSLTDRDDATFLLEVALQGRASMSYLDHPSVPRLAVGLYGGAPIILAASYPEGVEDPVRVHVTGPIGTPDCMRPDLRDLEAAKQSPENFFRVFKLPRTAGEHVDVQVRGHADALKSFSEWGFTDEDLLLLVQDFLTMKCRTDPELMKARVHGVVQKVGAVLKSTNSQVWLSSGLDETAKKFVTTMAGRTYGIWQESGNGISTVKDV